MSDDSATTTRYRRAFRKRERHIAMSWKDYVTRELNKNKSDVVDLLELRAHIIHTVKRSAKAFDSSACLSGNTAAGARLRRIRSDAAKHSNIECISSNRDIANSERELSKTFVLDAGSRHPSSDADITIMNAMCVDVLDDVMKNVNLAISPLCRRCRELDATDLEQMFNVHLFINSFLVALRGDFCHVDFRDLSVGTRTRQRRHAKARVMDFFSKRSSSSSRPPSDKENVGSFARARVNALLRSKMRALSSGDVDGFVNDTSAIARIFSSESYFTQGAFLHVLVEVQSGVSLDLTHHEYLDSAFENLGMLTDTLRDSRSPDAAHVAYAVSKYVSRMVHALGRFVETLEDGEKKKRAMDVLVDLVNRLDENTVHDDITRPRVYCSTGRLSRRLGRKNTAHVTFRSVVPRHDNNDDRSHNKTCSYYVPFRTLVDGKDPKRVIVTPSLKALRKMEAVNS